VIRELRQRFLPRFVQSARTHVERARTACQGAQSAGHTDPSSSGRWRVVRHEMHALSGEAAMLEIEAVGPLAKAAEGAAARAARQGEAAAEVDRLIDEIARALDTLDADVP
jgi:HPt (histidine-containing phosphotransfer) domain-containing protein